MKAIRFTSLFAAAAAMVSVTAGNAQAQGLFGNYNYGRPVPVMGQGYSSPCATGNCPQPQANYITNYAPANAYGNGYAPTQVYSQPLLQNCPNGQCAPGQCATGQCSPGQCLTGQCAPGQCANGQCSPQCQTICGPNGCQQICHPNQASRFGFTSPCGPNGCPPRGAVAPANYIQPVTGQFQSLNLDQTANWEAPVTPASYRQQGRPNFNNRPSTMTPVNYQGVVNTDLMNDPSIRQF